MLIKQLFGRISSDYGSQLEVLCEDGSKVRLTQFLHLTRPFVGDNVIFEGERLLEVLARKNQLSRLKSNGEIQTLATNLDQVWLCIPLDREPSLGRFERFSYFALSQGLHALLVLTKFDLCPNPQPWISLATSTGLDIILCSTLENKGIEELEKKLQTGDTALLLGQSGAGKTTLTNRLTGTNFPTNVVREQDHRGQHTTVTRNLVPTPSGGYLLDIPGFRELAWEEQQQLPDTWEHLATKCKFSDCTHQGQEGCALEKAVDTGELSRDSFTYWQKMQKEAAYQKRRTEKPAKGNSKKHRKGLSKQIRGMRSKGDW